MSATTGPLSVEPAVDQPADDAVPDGGRVAAAAPAPAGRRVRRRWRWAGAVATAGVAGVAVAAALGLVGGGSSGAPASSAAPPATAAVVRTTLVATEEFSGTLGYGEATVVSLPAAAANGTITWLPEAGQAVTRGEPVYAVDAEPVVLLYGSMPFFRPLAVGDSGADVAQLEENLAALGYDGFAVDDDYTWDTAEAVSQWQEDLGVAETGRFDPARVVVAGGEIRVAEQLVPLGAATSGQVLTYTGVDRRVTLELDVVDRPLVDEDLPVTVALPDGATVAGTVAEVGAVITGSTADSALGQPEAQPATFEVVVGVDDPDELRGWEAGPVTVELETSRREDVLAVPVGALVALAEGGYAVQVVDGAGTSYAPVTTGMFADGLVEVSGDGIAEGMLVGVPA